MEPKVGMLVTFPGYEANAGIIYRVVNTTNRDGVIRLERYNSIDPIVYSCYRSQWKDAVLYKKYQNIPKEEV